MTHSSASREPFESLLSAAEAALLLGIHPNTLLLWAREGRVPSLHLGRRVKFRASSLNEWLSGTKLVEPFALPSPESEAA
jgi:excisionase family DNA binding protein